MKIIENNYKRILLDPNYINGIQDWLNKPNDNKKKFLSILCWTGL